MTGRTNAGGGGKGCPLNVTAPAGATVTVSKDGLTKTKVAGSDGKAVFRGLTAGTWELSITDGTNTEYDEVEIVGDVALSFWDGYLLNGGDQCTAKTGGWLLTNGSVDDGILLAGPLGCFASMVTSDYVYMKKYNSLSVNISGYLYTDVYIYLIAKDGEVAGKVSYEISSNETREDIKVNIRFLSDAYRVKIEAKCSKGNTRANIYSVRCS